MAAILDRATVIARGREGRPGRAKVGPLVPPGNRTWAAAYGSRRVDTVYKNEPRAQRPCLKDRRSPSVGQGYVGDDASGAEGRAEGGHADPAVRCRSRGYPCRRVFCDGQRGQCPENRAASGHS
jgi:hypothetical protein